MLDTRFPRPRGDIGNALSYNFSVRYKIVRGAHATKIMGDRPDPSLLEPFIEAACELASEGVNAITTSCGFLAPFQKQLAEAAGIPVFASSLIQAPLIHAMLPPGKIIGVFTERAHHMNDDHFRGVGWSLHDLPVQIQGMKDGAQFPQTYIIGREELDTDVPRAEMTESFMASCPNPGAILFECTNMCPFSCDVAEISGLPVFDVNTLINFVYQAIKPADYLR